MLELLVDPIVPKAKNNRCPFIVFEKDNNVQS
jgi:hypothetical protein